MARSRKTQPRRSTNERRRDLHITVSPELHTKIIDAAEGYNLSMNHFVVKILTNYFKGLEDVRSQMEAAGSSSPRDPDVRSGQGQSPAPDAQIG